MDSNGALILLTLKSSVEAFKNKVKDLRDNTYDEEEIEICSQILDYIDEGKIEQRDVEKLIGCSVVVRGRKRIVRAWKWLILTCRPISSNNCLESVQVCPKFLRLLRTHCAQKAESLPVFSKTSDLNCEPLRAREPIKCRSRSRAVL